jgi:ribosomal protein S19
MPLFIRNRRAVVSKLSLVTDAYVYQGKCFVLFALTPLHLGYKLGQFTKTRKPFFFRSKKKK